MANSQHGLPDVPGKQPPPSLESLAVVFQSAMFCAGDAMRRASDKCPMEGQPVSGLMYIDGQLERAINDLARARLAVQTVIAAEADMAVTVDLDDLPDIQDFRPTEPAQANRKAGAA